MVLDKINTTAQLLQRAQQLCGFTLARLAREIGQPLPVNSSRAKGWTGQAIEQFLGAPSGSLAQADFPELGIELKTIPVNAQGLPAETTYVTTLNPSALRQQQWVESVVYQKLAKVLWVPIEGDRRIAFASRRVGMPCLWQPSPEQAAQLQQDWQEIRDAVCLGQLEELTSRSGEYLHIRPKAAHGKVLQQHGVKQTLPRGYYLRTALTRQILDTQRHESTIDTEAHIHKDIGDTVSE